MDKNILFNQPVLKKIVNSIIKEKKYSQAYLLEVNDMSYGLNIAIELSKYIICPNSYNCNFCNICSRIDKKIYPELEIIKLDDKLIKKEQVNKIKEKFQTKPIEGKCFVYIISGIEYLTDTAANSLLKFIEEPDSDIVAIFITENLNKVIDTIVSRCQVIKLNQIKEKYNIKKIIDYTGFDHEYLNKLISFVYDLENNKNKVIISYKDNILKNKDDIKNVKMIMFVLILIYKDILNIKIKKNAEIFVDYDKIKQMAVIMTKKKVISRITYILEYKEKLEYNLNINLFFINFLINLGEE